MVCAPVSIEDRLCDKLKKTASQWWERSSFCNARLYGLSDLIVFVQAVEPREEGVILPLGASVISQEPDRFGTSPGMELLCDPGTQTVWQEGFTATRRSWEKYVPLSFPNSGSSLVKYGLLLRKENRFHKFDPPLSLFARLIIWIIWYYPCFLLEYHTTIAQNFLWLFFNSAISTKTATIRYHIEDWAVTF